MGNLELEHGGIDPHDGVDGGQHVPPPPPRQARVGEISSTNTTSFAIESNGH